MWEKVCKTQPSQALVLSCIKSLEPPLLMSRRNKSLECIMHMWHGT